MQLRDRAERGMGGYGAGKAGTGHGRGRVRSQRGLEGQQGLGRVAIEEGGAGQCRPREGWRAGRPEGREAPAGTCSPPRTKDVFLGAFLLLRSGSARRRPAVIRHSRASNIKLIHKLFGGRMRKDLEAVRLDSA